MSKTASSRSEWRWPVRLAVAGTATVFVVVGYLSDLGATEQRPVGVGRVSSTTAPASSTTDTTPNIAAAPSPTTTKPSARRAVSTASSHAAQQTRSTPERAALDWVDALGRGDVKTAAALVGPKSRRYIESLGGNVEGLMRESQEGYGPWGRAADRQTTEIDLGVVEGSPVTIVVLSGTPRGEGRDGFSTDAIPAVHTGAGWVVETTAFRSDTGGRLVITPPTHKSDTISASAPGSGDFFFSLEDQPAVRVAAHQSGGGVQATWDPPGDMAAHRHLLVVAYADGDTLTATSAVVDVS